jgi:hypothetical protein
MSRLKIMRDLREYFTTLSQNSSEHELTTLKEDYPLLCEAFRTIPSKYGQAEWKPVDDICDLIGTYLTMKDPTYETAITFREQIVKLHQELYM